MQVGDTVGDYIIEEKLGAGGMATVYRARHAVLDTLHALKALNAEYRVSAEARRRFLDEAKIQAKHLLHANIVRVINIVATADVAALVMDLVDGGSLEEYITKHEDSFTDEEVLALALPILEGMRHAHERGIIHRDLKPANILLRRGPLRVEPVITDFGIAKVRTPDEPSKKSTHHDARMGTVGYSSPEQIVRAKDVTERSDIFSLGAVFYEIATGHAPYPGASDFEIMEKIVRGRLEPLERFNPGLSPRIAGAIRKALETDPENRFASCADFAAALSQTSGTSIAPTASQPPVAMTAPTVAKAPPPPVHPSEPLVEDRGAIELLRRAHDLHFAQRFGEAKFLYEQLVSKYTTSKQANAARNQIENLKKFTARAVVEAPIVRGPGPPKAEAAPRLAAGSEMDTAKGALRTAHGLHFDKAFPKARQVYEEIIARWPDSKEAAAAAQQLKNLGKL